MSVIRVLDHISLREAHVQHEEDRARLRAAKARSLANALDDSLACIGSRARGGEGGFSRRGSAAGSVDRDEELRRSGGELRGPEEATG